MLVNRMLVIGTAFFLDLLLGDPYWFPHPIRFIGSLIGKLDSYLYHQFRKNNESLLRGGVILAVLVVLVSTGIPLLIVWLGYRLSTVAGVLAEGFLCYTLLATKSLKDESMKVYEAFRKRDVEGARYAVSRIVGRDTEPLSESGIMKAAIETVAENTSDGSIAPMLYLAIGGAPLGFFYKAVNTMDSMIGYKNDKYLYFGRCAAKLDDIVNYIPARISAYFMIAASFFLKMNWRKALFIYRRDCKNHASPNSAQTESVCAGALGIELAGNAWYFGKLVEKPTIGDSIKPVEAEDIKRANRLLYGTAWISFLLIELLAGILWLLAR
ncbi:adenosylcobinamide-phosphate synthase CbiB [[Clostridium] polysaccharolyticum]|uniref:Cobalamin biosynthesis protein CobD n=1 Tax=[Clostridium] polysaccharolyticum TaxID=29364 RepID=A0A1I0B9N9_9FIRM|nr:adenosylcobinamide-phosphate synthase CbiB [[Clostridium] polysaccharolyticum]SET03513.1 adenosylcobinamide-phosphate synthase [[Clostridium] polysaccharolyticum]